MSYVPFGKYADIRNEDTAKALRELDRRICELENTSSVEIPIVNPDGTPFQQLHPRILEYVSKHEERHLKDVVKWLEEMLDCKFQIVRTPDEEGGYELR